MGEKPSAGRGEPSSGFEILWCALPSVESDNWSHAAVPDRGQRWDDADTHTHPPSSRSVTVARLVTARLELLMRRAGLACVSGRPRFRRIPNVVATASDLVERSFRRDRLWVIEITRVTDATGQGVLRRGPRRNSGAGSLAGRSGRPLLYALDGASSTHPEPSSLGPCPLEWWEMSGPS